MYRDCRLLSTLSRTIYLSKPPAEFIEADKAVLEGMEAGLEAARAGNCCQDIANVFFAVLKNTTS